MDLLRWMVGAVVIAFTVVWLYAELILLARGIHGWG